MTDQGGFQADETAPIAATFPAATFPAEIVASTANSAAPIAQSFAPSAALPAVVPPAAPIVMTPAGWYPLNGEQRYWDGLKWTEHRARAALPVYRPVFQAPMVVTDARTNGAEVAIAWVLTVLSIGYMLPWAIAATRGKSNSWAVGLVNFLLGWTFIGWIVALVMACTAHQVAFVQHRT
jgi:T4 superinfection immunity protein/uncharacterized protein DUF2510